MKRDINYLSNIDISEIKGFGEKRIKSLNKSGIKSIVDLIRFYPRKHIDRSDILTIDEVINLFEFKEITVLVKIEKVSVFTTRSRLRIATLSVSDETGDAKAKWFGPQYIETRFKEGDTVAISGVPDVKKTGSVEFKNATIEKYLEFDELNETGALIPIYKKIDDNEKIYTITRDVFVDTGLIFFGGYASGLYSKYNDNNRIHQLQKIPDFDVLSEDPERTALILKEQLEEAGIKDIKIKHNDKIGEVVPENIEVIIGKEDTIAMIHKPIACHSYNQITINGRKINVASIDTIMSLYLSFIYADSDLHSTRLLCMAKYLFDIQEQNKLNQKGLLKRFVDKCYGKQATIDTIRSEKSNKYKELKSDPNSREYQEWFLKYTPGEKTNKQYTKKQLPPPTKGNKILKLLGL